MKHGLSGDKVLGKMVQFQNQTPFGGRLLMVGFGCIGQGVLPLLLRHLDLSPAQIQIVARDDAGSDVASQYGATLTRMTIRPDNYADFLASRLQPGDLLLNVAVGVSSIDLIEWCQRQGVLYLDTSIEPWEGEFLEAERSAAERSNYMLREAVLGLRRSSHPAATALTGHGANPGLVTHFVKQALLNIAGDTQVELPTRPLIRGDWAQLARQLSISSIQVAERDTQTDRRRKQADEFVNTWSVQAFINESRQPAELGWGTHERDFPTLGYTHTTGCRSSIYLNRAGAATHVGTWTPMGGDATAFLISHGESISISDYLTIDEGGKAAYRPTVHFAYCPTEDAAHSLQDLLQSNWSLRQRHRVLNGGITSGMEELGVLLGGHSRGGYWFGSRLSIDQTRDLVPHNNATTLQVAAAVVAGLIWVIRNPWAGIIEAGDIDFQFVLSFATPYLGTIVREYTAWNPLLGCDHAELGNVDVSDAWQFHNFLRCQNYGASGAREPDR